MSNNLIKASISGLLAQPIFEKPNKQQEIKSKIAFGLLLVIFLGIGGMLIISALERNTLKAGPLIFGLILCVFPFLLYLLVSKTKARMISKIDRNGIEVRSGKFYAWEDLKNITYHMAMKKYDYQSPDQCYMMDFYFKSGSARANFLMQHFTTILFISNALPVLKKEKVNAYRR